MIKPIDIKPYLLFDGAMGTYFASMNRTDIQKCELANIYAPETIEAIHKEYIAAGACAVKTNTFAANRISLGVDFPVMEKIIKAGYSIACKAAIKSNAWVFADIGPIPETEEDNFYEYQRVMDVFLDCGAEAFLFETFYEYEIILECARYLKSKNKNIFILAQFAVSPDGYTRKGIPFKKIFLAMQQCADIDAYGLNCISGPKHIYENLTKAGKTNKPLSAMPNAGYPSMVGERTFYNFNASYFASVMADLYAAGVTILGGCCGTTPEHIAAAKKALEQAGMPAAETKEEKEAIRPVAKTTNRFKEKLQKGEKVIAVELDPPFHADVSKIIAGALAFKDAGADIITVADNPLARARADSAIIAAKIRRECGIETLPHITCRDRNLNAIKAMLLGLHIEGIRNVLAVTGDPVPEGDRSDIKGVFNMNSRMLAAYIGELNQTVFEGDGLFTGGAFNVNANKPELELKRAQEKIQSGVQYFLTQPVFSENAMHSFFKARNELKAKMLMGIMPLISYKNACFLNNEVSGITINEEIMAAFEGKSNEEAEKLGIAIAFKTAMEASDKADGFYIITPVYRVDVICELIKQIRRILH